MPKKEQDSLATSSSNYNERQHLNGNDGGSEGEDGSSFEDDDSDNEGYEDAASNLNLRSQHTVSSRNWQKDFRQKKQK